MAARTLVALFVILVVGIVQGKVQVEGEYELSQAVYMSNGSVVMGLKLEGSEEVLAKATYAHSLNGDWNKLWVNSVSRSKEALYAAGVLEGKLSAKDIEEMYVNTYADWFTDSPFGPKPMPVFRFLKQNYDWMKDQVERLSGSSEYWRTVGLVLAQLEGLAEGYMSESNLGKVRKLSVEDFLFLNADGDIESLTEFLPQKDANNVRHAGQRCSAIFKILPNNSDVLFAHTTWDHYTMMLRTLKTYRFGETFVTFSSSPAFLSSVDDFYITGNGLAVIETTNGNHNRALWQRVSPKSVLSWVRVIVANMVASTAKDWMDSFSQMNSGTYNNQWMVLDTKRFVRGERLQNNTFWVLEQLPELIVAEDKSQELQDRTYWASYNIPYYGKVYNVSGFNKLKPKWKFSHSHGPRADIFRSKQEDIQTVEDMKRAIRYNDFRNDAMSRGDACNQISARCDLNSGLAHTLSGGIDGKVSSISLIRTESSPLFWAQQGPSYDDQPPYSWKNFKPSVRYPRVPKHVGQIEGNFTYEWKLFKVNGEYADN